MNTTNIYEAKFDEFVDWYEYEEVEGEGSDFEDEEYFEDEDKVFDVLSFVVGLKLGTKDVVSE